MLWIGLTGGIASGKSSVSALLRDRGQTIVDADQLAREVVQIGTPALHEIKKQFGPDLCLATGELDRKKLGAMIFADPVAREKLERILHPRIRELAALRKAELATKGLKLAFYDVPLLFEKNMEPLFDLVIVVVAEPETQIARLMARDSISRTEAERRLLAQIPIGEKAKRAGLIIRNNGNRIELERETERALEEIKNKIQVN